MNELTPVIFFKLITGEEFIAFADYELISVDEEEGNGLPLWTIHFPLKINMVEDSGNKVACVLLPWLPFLEENTISISDDSVIIAEPVSNEVEKNYKRIYDVKFKNRNNKNHSSLNFDIDENGDEDEDETDRQLSLFQHQEQIEDIIDDKHQNLLMNANTSASSMFIDMSEFLGWDDNIDN